MLRWRSNSYRKLIFFGRILQEPRTHYMGARRQYFCCCFRKWNYLCLWYCLFINLFYWG